MSRIIFLSFACSAFVCAGGLSSPVPAETPGLDPAVLNTGRVQYILCGACHGMNGEGGAAGPPLAGSEWVTGPVENLIRIQLRGLRGPITVKGQTYEFAAAMAPLAYQNDDQIAAVLTYVRNSFGNSASAVSPEQVAALRGEVGKPMLTEADLLPPDGSLTKSVSGKYDVLQVKPPWRRRVLPSVALLLAAVIAWRIFRRAGVVG